ncbi:MAG: sulfatase-like hydrolase/transferase, partial [Acidobacteriota bacterium]
MPQANKAALLFCLAAAALPTVPASATERPNIVFVLADDLGYGDVGAYGGTTIQTPEIDALTQSGVRFTQGYVTHPVCSPSRAGLMTGRYQQRHGWEFNPAGRDRGAGLSLEERTLGDVLRDAGYRTGLVGKWHLGQQPNHRPTQRGFDEYFGILEGGSIFIDSRKPGVESASLRGGRGPTERHNTVWRARRGTDGRTVEEAVDVDEYLTDVFTDEALRFIGASDEQPFFLFLSHTTPHTPLQATVEYLEPYRHIEDPAKRVYAAMVASLDASVGRLREALEKSGQLEDTLFVFASDNGCAGYIFGACSNAPLRGFKRYHHEGGVRVPFVVSWPARLAAGQVVDTPVSTLDLFATFAAAA